MGHRRAALLGVLLFLAFFQEVFAGWQVIFPHDNAREIGAESPGGQARRSNRKFSDLSSTVIPEIQAHLSGNRVGWLSTWNPHVGLGRPNYQFAGLGRAFAPTHLVMLLTDDAFVAYTVLAILAVLLTGLFGYLFLASLDLVPLACLAGAVWLALGVFVTYWLTFVMFVWGLCWTLALLAALSFFLRRATPARGLGVVAALHALLLSGYPQESVWGLYLAGAFGLVTLLQSPRSVREKARSVAILAALGCAALVSVAPVFADLRLEASRSVRRDYDPSYFLASLPALSSWRDLAGLLTRGFDASWFGNPIDPHYPFPFDGHSLTPPLAALATATLLPALARRVLFWQAFSGLCVLLTLWPGAYLFGVRNLGLSFSRWTPLSAALIPVAVLAAHAVDHAVRDPAARRHMALLALLPAALALPGAWDASEHLRPGLVVAGAAFLAGALGFLASGRAAVLALVLVAGALHYGGPLVLSRPRNEIHMGSPLVASLRRGTAGGLRFASVSRSAIPPNQEGLLDLASVHTYDSLASEAYARFVPRLSDAGVINHGRMFLHLSPARLDPDALASAGVGVLLSPRPLPSSVATPIARRGAFVLHRCVRSPIRQAQLAAFARNRDGGFVLPKSLEGAASLGVERVVDRDDRLLFRVARRQAETLLFVSQQYHPHWRASSGSRELVGAPADGFYQAVLLPPGTEEVELRFLPWARFSWIPQAALLLAAALLLVRPLLRRRPRFAGLRLAAR